MDGTQLAKVREEIDEHNGEEWIAKFGASFIVYYSGTFKENAEGILHFYNTVIDRIAPTAAYFHIDGKNQPRKIKDQKEILGYVPFWTSDECEDRGLYGLTLESSEDKYGVSDKAFHLYEGFDEGYIRVILPAEVLLTETEDFVTLVREAAGKLALWSGVGGFGLNLSAGYPTDSPNRVVQVAGARYRCIDVAPPHALATSVDQGIKDVSWLTLIGTEHLKPLGGAEGLSNKLSGMKNVDLYELEHGVMIRLGPVPKFGASAENINEYYELGSILKPAAIPRDHQDAGDYIGGIAFTEEWLYRFFR